MAKAFSIFNHVLGPVMRGPSSSHTAGAYHLGCMARSLLGGQPAEARLAFDPGGSYARTYAAQGADRAFAQGFLGRSLTDDSFFTALDDAPGLGLDLQFEVRPLEDADHPNTVELVLANNAGEGLTLRGRSIGGGEVEITRVDDWDVCFDGAAFEWLVETNADGAGALEAHLAGLEGRLTAPATQVRGRRAAVLVRSAEVPSSACLAELRAEGAERVRVCRPVYRVARGAPLFLAGSEMVALAAKRELGLGELALAYEAQLLGLEPAAVLSEMERRLDIMKASVEQGLAPNFNGLTLMPASAGKIFGAAGEGRLSTNGPHTRAAARALAVMHVNGAMGVVCAAPTGGSAGVLPGLIVTLAEERRLDRETQARALLAAGAIGLVVAQRATFAAEVAGCQVEIGAAGAMAAAAVVDAFGGSARQAADAAAIALQNTMGSVCDLLHGRVEIPCHTRNAAAAAGAFVCADLVMGGYPNPIPLDETVDAVLEVGRMMPAELRCTSRGGLAVTPSARALGEACCGSGCRTCR